MMNCRPAFMHARITVTSRSMFWPVHQTSSIPGVYRNNSAKRCSKVASVGNPPTFLPMVVPSMNSRSTPLRRTTNEPFEKHALRPCARRSPKVLVDATRWMPAPSTPGQSIAGAVRDHGPNVRGTQSRSSFRSVQATAQRN